MRRLVGDRSGELVDAEVLEPLVVEPVGPVDASESVFDAGQPCHPLVDLGVDSVELLVRVSVPEVGGPTPQDGVEVADYDVQVSAGVASMGSLPDLGPDGGHGPF